MQDTITFNSPQFVYLNGNPHLRATITPGIRATVLEANHRGMWLRLHLSFPGGSYPCAFLPF